MNNELAANKTFNNETSRTGMLIPTMLRTDAASLTDFLGEYYKLSNTAGNSTNLINDFLREHDIDSVTEQFFSGIQNLIARNIPNSKFDRQTLYKRIIDYYSIRGSENSVKAFFKIFYNKEAILYYPKNDLLKPSDGKYSETWPDWIKGQIRNTSGSSLYNLNYYNSVVTEFVSEVDRVNINWTYSAYDTHDPGIFLNTDGYISDVRLKVQDSYYWQDFSYEIQTELSDYIWKNDYLKLVHPAGLMFFQRVAATIVSVNSWIKYDYEYLDEIITKIVPPPLSGDHTPAEQYSSFYQIIPTNFIIQFPGIIAQPVNVTLTAIIELGIISSVMTSINPNYYSASQLNMNSTDYMNQLKFIDSSIIAGFGSHVIQPLTIDTTHSYSPIDGAPYSYRFPPTAISAIITISIP